VAAASVLTDVIADATRQGVVQLGSLAILARLVIDSLRWAAAEYMLTDRRALAQEGALQPTVAAIPLDEIDEVTLTVTPLQRLTGTGSLHFRVEGYAEPVMTWRHIPHASEIREAVQHAITRARRNRSHG
jgi:membrane protein YdbS with pleckstrin-like domain